MPGNGVTTGGDTFNQDRWIRFGNPDIQNLPPPQAFTTGAQTITAQMLFNSIVVGVPNGGVNVNYTLDTTANILAMLNKKYSDTQGARIGDSFSCMFVNAATVAASTITIVAGDAKTTVVKAGAIPIGSNQVCIFYVNDPTGASTPSLTVYG